MTLGPGLETWPEPLPQPDDCGIADGVAEALAVAFSDQIPNDNSPAISRKTVPRNAATLNVAAGSHLGPVGEAIAVARRPEREEYRARRSRQ